MVNAIAFKEYKVVSEFISEDSDDFSRRFLQIIQSALGRAEAAEAFFGSAAQNAPDSVSRAFFLQLANKKALHRRIVEKIGLNAELLSCPMNDGESECAKASPPYDSFHSPRAAQPAVLIRNIFELVYEKAMDELDFYLNFVLIEKHPIITSLLFSLANLSKDFLFEVKLRYLEHQSKMKTVDSEEIVEHFIKLERRWN